MANTTFFKRNAPQPLESQKIFFESKIDFSKKNVVSGDSFDLCDIPKGAVISRIGWFVHTTQAGITFQVGNQNDDNVYLSATGIGGNNTVVAVDPTYSSATADVVPTTSTNTLRVTVSGANATTAVVTFFVELAVLGALNAS